MPALEIPRPETGEYAEYFAQYVDLVPDGPVLDYLEGQLARWRELVGGLDESGANHRYAPGKWSVKEVIGHVVDCERVFLYRALRASRGDATPLPGFDQDVFAAGADFDRRPLDDVLDELENARRSSLRFLRTLRPEALSRGGVAEEKRFTVRMLAYLMAGHDTHHMNVVRERYVSG